MDTLRYHIASGLIELALRIMPKGPYKTAMLDALCELHEMLREDLARH